ncbi:hypothetical protein WG902_06945 [Ramlibacter sp. PS3R-8]|uniref:hypothetical protein n=1 Tax=Ramlibacter sp. PS3R-8 TaxID=3133437 RepID=UPI0030A94468
MSASIEEPLMTVTVNYTFGVQEGLSPPFLSEHADAASIANGGIAVVGDRTATNSSMSLFQADGDPSASGIAIAGTQSAVAELSNGRMVVASDRGQQVYYTITRSDGAVSVPSTASDAAFEDVSNVDVAGLAGGGFVVVSQALIGGTDNDIRMTVRTNTGSLVTFATLDVSTENDQNPSVAALADGGFAVAWHRRLSGGGEELWYAVYESNGDARLVPTRLDNEGNVNRNATVAAMDGGGFAIAYEDTGWSGNTDIDITLARFTAAGSLIDWSDISQNNVNDTDPSMTVLSNGMIAVGATLDNGATPTNVRWTLVDPDTGTKLGTSGAGSSGNYERSTSVAAMLDGRMAAFFTDNDAGDVEGEILQAKRISVGDASDDVIIGDDLFDDMQGAGGADTLIGGLNGDYLKGGGGGDTFEFHARDIVGDTVAGGAGSDRLFFTANGNASGAVLTSIEEIEFFSPTSAPLTVTIGASQVGAGLDAGLIVDGDLAGSATTLRIVMGSDTDVSLAGFTFQDFDTGGSENDRIVIVGDADAEDIAGSSLRDDIAGGGGSDRVNGRGGNDMLGGGGGDDVLAGGTGTDTLAGGTGADRFDFNASSDSLAGPGRDVISDFVGNGSLAGDRVDLSTLDANVLAAGNQSFTFIGNAAFSGAGQARYAGGVLSLNMDGDVAAEMQVALTGAPALVADDLVL